MILGRNDFINEIAEYNNITKIKAETSLDYVIATIYKCLADGNSIRFRNFGTFEVYTKSARAGIDPDTKGQQIIPAHKYLRFNMCERLKEDIRKLEVTEDD